MLVAGLILLTRLQTASLNAIPQQPWDGSARRPECPTLKCGAVLTGLTQDLHRKADLDPEQVATAISELIRDDISTETKADFLVALARKGETIDEIAAFARELRKLSIHPPIDAVTRNELILDVCGTGGDRLNTFNISTTVGFVVAAAGVAVAKHGNRGVTSQSGSADVLEALGIPIDLAPEEAAASLAKRRFAFFFAPKYHPSFRQIAPARKLCAERGQRTVFNVLGPLLNPAQPSAQLVGVPHADYCERIAKVLQVLGLRRAMVVSGKTEGGWLDEFSTLGDTMVAEFYQERGFSSGLISPALLDVQPATLEDLRGGDKQANALIIRRLLAGQEHGPKREAVLLNGAAALLVAGQAHSLQEGWAMAADLIDSGRALAKLDELASQGH